MLIRETGVVNSQLLQVDVVVPPLRMVGVSFMIMDNK